MKASKDIRSILILFFMLTVAIQTVFGQTTALWLFDEQTGLYPSSVLDDASANDYPLVIGLGGQIVPGKFGNALEPQLRPEIKIPSGETRFGLKELPAAPGRTVPPLTWMNANFCALMTMGENHLRKEVGFVNPTRTKLNLGDFDWTVEFWYQTSRITGKPGVVFEIGQGPRGENEKFTVLSVNENGDGFTLVNEPSGTTLKISSAAGALSPANGNWHHFAFVYSFAEKILRHFVDGKLLSALKNVSLKKLPEGEEAYLSLGRGGLWDHPLPGKIDELRFSSSALYKSDFTPPKSSSPFFNGSYQPVMLKKGLPLLFENVDQKKPLNLDNRKYLFLDDALLDKKDNIRFVVNPPRKAERVIDHLDGPFRKHLTVVEDDSGLIRIYNSVDDDYLQVMVSKDGIHFEAPDLGRGEYKGHRNIVIPASVGGLGNPFIDINGPASERWKYISGYHRRGIYLFTSPDGFTWKRYPTAILPFRSGTQSCSFYDEQRQRYVGYHRTGIARTPGGATQRESVYTESRDAHLPWPFKPAAPEDYRRASRKMRLRQPLPWYLDNGPLTPGGFGIEFPHKFTPIDTLDPVGTDIYVTKAQKYPWAPDAYLAFPIVYFHYEDDGPPTRQILMSKSRGRGSGPIETQISVSRDGVNWKRYPRPAYVGIGEHAGRDIKTVYIAQGMVRRGNEIWQYYFGETQYHSSWVNRRSEQAVYRLVQRLDGFVSADAPYDQEATLVTKPLVFSGNRLILNIDTDATGYAQVGFLDEKGNPIQGFSVDNCIYINGDFIETEVEWMKQGRDVSSLAGKTVQVVIRMRGSKLYSLQFVKH